MMLARAITPLLAAAREPIPPLRPPHAELPPTFWESNNGLVFLAGVFVGMAVMGWWLWRRSSRRRALDHIDPLAIARAKLETLAASDAESAKWPELVPQIVRWALIERFQLPWMEYTTEEFKALIRANGWLPEPLVADLARLLDDCDRARFASLPGANNTASLPARAVQLLAQAAAVTTVPSAQPPVIAATP